MLLAKVFPPTTNYLNCPTFQMVAVPGGTFMMGGDNYEREQPIHQVAITDFAMGKYPVTQEVWELVMQGTDMADPAGFKGKHHPVERVSWDDAQVFLERLNAIPEIAAQNAKDASCFQLPSEAQWEYAARGGQDSVGFPFAGSHRLKEVAWYYENSHNATKPVGLKLPNELGLYDMSGNVREWCADYWHNNYEGAPSDGSAWLRDNKESAGRVVRGGSWNINNNYCRVSYRIRFSIYHNNRNYGIGFRLARYQPPER